MSAARSVVPRLAAPPGRVSVLLPCAHALCETLRAQEFPAPPAAFDRLEVGERLGEVQAELTYYDGPTLIGAVFLSDQIRRGAARCGPQTQVVVLDAAVLASTGRLVVATLPVNLTQVGAALRDMRRLRNSVSLSRLAGHRRYQQALAAAFELTYAKLPLMLPETAFLCGPCDEEREGTFGLGVSVHAGVRDRLRVQRDAPVMPVRDARPADLDLAAQSRRTGLRLTRRLDAQLLEYAARHAQDVALFLRVRDGVVAAHAEQTCFVTLRCGCGEVFCGVWTDDEVFCPDVLPGRLRFDASRALPPVARGLPPRRTWVNLCPACAAPVPLPAARAASLLGGRILAALLWHTDTPL